MGTENLENLGLNELKKKKKGAKFLIIMLAIVIIVCITVLVVLFILSKPFNAGVFASTMGCITIGIIIYAGKRKIDIELQRREDKQSNTE
ncbi:MAG: hypothetical protein E4H13_05260 [Calditrichales bacterium]|nr:MAG: hypothetical protein E4H13_05260 [Calditrichales bacterium]